mgnify:CR=1 FL=1
MKTGIKVQDVMTRNPVKVKTTNTVKECAQIMKENVVGSLLVFDNSDNLYGLVTERDFCRKAIAEGISLDTPVMKISERQLYTVKPEMDLFDAMKYISEKNVRHLPVLGTNDFVGFITVKDILKLQPQLIEIMVERMQIKEQDKKLAILGEDFLL